MYDRRTECYCIFYLKLPLISGIFGSAWLNPPPSTRGAVVSKIRYFKILLDIKDKKMYIVSENKTNGGDSIMTSTVSSRGQLVIPSRLRAKYRIKASSKVEWIDTGKVITLIPIPDDVITSSRGILKKTSTQTLLHSRKKDKELEG